MMVLCGAHRIASSERIPLDAWRRSFGGAGQTSWAQLPSILRKVSDLSGTLMASLLLQEMTPLSIVSIWSFSRVPGILYKVRIDILHIITKSFNYLRYIFIVTESELSITLHYVKIIYICDVPLAQNKLWSLHQTSVICWGRSGRQSAAWLAPKRQKPPHRR